jgi:hypothetical protein
MSSPTVIDPAADQREAVRARIAHMQQLLKQSGQEFRAPPPEPTTCCGRGCNGCVWEGYEAALAWWFEEAQAVPGVVNSNLFAPHSIGLAP